MDLQTGIVYGPLESRRFGRSLGVNLAPPGRKTCNYNCAYCQYGWTQFPTRGEFPRPSDVIDAVDRTTAARTSIAMPASASASTPAMVRANPPGSTRRPALDAV